MANLTRYLNLNAGDVYPLLPDTPAGRAAFDWLKHFLSRTYRRKPLEHFPLKENQYTFRLGGLGTWACEGRFKFLEHSYPFTCTWVLTYSRLGAHFQLANASTIQADDPAPQDIALAAVLDLYHTVKHTIFSPPAGVVPFPSPSTTGMRERLQKYLAERGASVPDLLDTITKAAADALPQLDVHALLTDDGIMLGFMAKVVTCTVAPKEAPNYGQQPAGTRD